MIEALSAATGQLPLASESVDDQIRALATLASVVLALLTFFTIGRAEAYRRLSEAGIGGLTWRSAGQAIPDLALLLLTVGALVTMAPLLFSSFHFSDIGHQDGALPTMFALVCLGFLGLSLFQGYLLCARLGPAIRNR